VVGSRVSNGVLAFDDVSDDKNSRTHELRDQLYQWVVNAVMPILSGNRCRIWSIGTRWAEGDVVSRQIATGEFQSTELKAVYKDETTGHLRSYWPMLYPFKKLLQILNMVGKTSFMLSYLNNSTGLQGAIFTADMLRTDYPRDDEGRPIFPEFDIIYLSVDAALKARQANDESAVAAVGIRTSPHTSLPQVWVLKLEHGQWGNMQVLERLETMWSTVIRNYNAKEYQVLFETVAGQQLFLTLMEEKPGFSIPMTSILTYNPVIDKGTRARPTAAAGERGDLIVDLNAPWYPRWFSQFIEFTGAVGQSDDLVDVLTQVVIYEFGDIGSYASFNATYDLTDIRGLSV
jgi:predicted phage terminase large subunit-like protein